MFEHISSQEILKWASLVFLAGFIGFFGKYLGRVVLSLFQKKKDSHTPEASLSEQALKPGVVDTQGKSRQPEPSGGGMTRDDQKLLKKALKAQAKAKKKSDE